MFTYCVVVLAACLQVISAQIPPNVPPHCRAPPPGVEKPHECCKIPSFFKPEDFEKCGFPKPEKLEGPPPPPHGPPDCTKQLCMMDSYGLAKNGKPDPEALSVFMDNFVDANPAFKDSIGIAKERCLGKDLPGPPHVCEANKLVFCISSTVFAECPTWEPTDNCKILKDHMEQCKPYFTNS